MKTKFIAAPGTYIAREIKDNSVVLTGSSKTRIIKGEVIEVGKSEKTDFGILIPVPVVKGDIAHFLSYEGSYDCEKIDGELYYTVLRKDHRFVTL